MPSPDLVDATDLASWANRLDARGQLPHLIRRLILKTSTGVSRIRMPAGEGIQAPGWDGVAEVGAGNAWVPDGRSVWEMGVNQDTKGKADDDYSKRTQDPGGVDPANTTFVFVTPRRWQKKDEWARDKARTGAWRDVRAFDAEDLETWLETAHGVHVWISDRLGKDPNGIQPLETFWAEWADATQPRLSAELVIAGRDDAAERVRQALQTLPRSVVLRADSPDEAIAFLAASIRQLPEIERTNVFSSAVVVSDSRAFARAVSSDGPLVLIPQFDVRNVSRAVSAGHHVVVPVGGDRVGSDDAIELPRVRRSAVKEALLGLGLSEARAENLATVARRSMLSLRRQLAVNPELQQPAWAEPSEGRALLPALLAGTWDEKEAGDKQVLGALAGLPYEQIATNLTRWANEIDPPVRRIGTTWVIVSREDAWRLLSRLLSSDDLQRFGKVVWEVLSGIDPALELPPDQRSIASLIGRSRPHSSLVRTGLSELLVVAGSLSSDDLVFSGEVSGRDLADGIVRRLLSDANKDRSGRLWASIADVLPTLAEAAPDTFIAAIDSVLSEQSPVIIKLFADPSSPYTMLLWALECLAWSPVYLGRAALQLARLTRLDPGGELMNRPSNSLRDLFRLWYPQTAATLEQRLRELDVIRARESAVAWRLLIALIPSNTETATPTYAPRWRDWKPDDEIAVTPAEFSHGMEELVTRLLADVGEDGNSWSELVQTLEALPVELANRVLDQLLAIEVHDLTDDDREAMQRAIRDTIFKHRRFPDADWALPKDFVDRLAAAYGRFTPTDQIRRHKWLFVARPHLMDVDDADYGNYSATVTATRTDVLRSVYEANGLSGVTKLASAAEQSWAIGHILGQNLLRSEDESLMLALLDSDDPHQGELVAGYIVSRFSAAGWDWAESILSGAAEAWTPDEHAAFLRSLPPGARTWDWAVKFDSETASSYWRKAPPFRLSEPNECRRAVAELLKADRPYAAVEVLGLCVDQVAGFLEPDLIATTLERAPTVVPGADVDMGMVRFDVSRLLNYLEKSGAIDESRLASLEWIYLPLLEHSERRTKSLHAALSKDPDFFAEVVSLVYRSEGEEPAEVGRLDAGRAERGNRLLNSWRGVPGVVDGVLAAESLRQWVTQARSLLAAKGRRAVGDLRIGEVLRYSPNDDDAAWPHAAVRDLIEEIASDDLERGIEIEVQNSRGVTQRGLTDGGEQERAIVARFLTYAQIVGPRWPRTEAMLRRIANTFRREARRQDTYAELREDLWD